MAASKVLLVSGSANFSTRDVWDGYRIALQEIGIDVIPYPTFSFLKVLSSDSVCSDILGTAVDLKHGIDCVVFIDGLYFRGDRARVPQSIRNVGIPTVLIATDDPYESIPNLAGLYTYRFTNEIRCAGDQVDYLPTATLPQPLLPHREAPTYDISFVGTTFADRLPLLNAIADHCESTGRRFLVAGKLLEGSETLRNRTFTDVRSRAIDEQEKLSIYTDSRFVLNLFRQSEHPAESPSPRVFEVTGLGHAALLTGPDRSEVREIFGNSVYHFRDTEDAIRTLETALAADPNERLQKVARAQEITENAHLYHHRAEQFINAVRRGEQRRSSIHVAENRIAWIIGGGRTGSTWLSEMLADLPRIRRWHEPYFGRFLKHVHDRPQDRDRASSFFATRHQNVWIEGLRELFFRMVRERYPQVGEHALVIKEVNTPEFNVWLRKLFPASRMILLTRDPFDIFDSYLDLQKPNSWNAQFGDREAPLSEANLQNTAEHIRATLEISLNAFEAFPRHQKIHVSYESLLQDPVAHLTQCAALVDVEVSSADINRTIEKHRFENQRETGALQFRRHGKAGIWRESANFTSQTREIADTVLGPIRGRLGYAI